jgi:small redox-active disulfide protein 2
MLTINVYGPGCANCRKLEEISLKALADAGVQGEVVKVTATPDIVAAGVLKTPGLAINGKLVSTGRIPAPASVLQWIREAQAPG